MFEIGILIGIYGYCIFALGLMGLLYAPAIWAFTTVFFGISMIVIRGKIEGLEGIRWIRELIKDKLSLILFSILIIQILVNFIGALGPELGFDALWYHLTIPKIYLINHTITYIPGGLLFYSSMPKFLELLYAGGLAFGPYIFPKLTHFGFGILILFTLYKISKKFFSQRMSFLVLVIFYSNLVVGWESISAYIDLGRAFFELLSFWAFLKWSEKKEKRLLIYSAIFMGIAVTSKLLALGSLLVMCFL